MRIAIFSDSTLPMINGVSISIDELVSQLRDLGHSVYIFAPQINREAENDPNIYRFRTLNMPWAKGVPVAFPPFLRMLRKFRRHKFDVIHLHTIGTVSFVGLRWGQSHDIPVVATYHTLYDRYTHYFPVLPYRYVRFKIAKHTNFFYNHVDRVITPSETSLKWLRRHSVSTPSVVIKTGIRPARTFERAEARLQLKIAPQQTILLFVGRLAVEKNMETLLQAASKVFDFDSNHRLWIVGDGPYRTECQMFVRKLGIGDKVKFAGFVARDEVDQYYAAADAFVFASMTETQGLVVQEAMSYGLPPIVVEGGGASGEIIAGFNGLLAKNDPTDLAKKIIQVTHDDDLYAHLSDGAKKTSRQTSSTAMGEMVVKVYQDAIDERKGESRALSASIY